MNTMNYYYPATSLCKNEFCMIASALSSSLIATLVFSNKQLKEDFENTLDEDQRKIYSKIKKERTYIFIIASILGLVFGFGAYKIQRSVCLAISVIITCIIMIYKLWPKSDYILNHIYSSSQSKVWMDLNRHMSKLSDIGLLVGIVLYLVMKQLL